MQVVAPVEPKTNIGRHNLSPFTAASLLERNSTTPPNYKFHVPRAVDSIIQEPSRSLYGLRVNSSATMPSKEASSLPRGVENQIHRDKDDGFAAILIDRIRTKAELKQVHKFLIILIDDFLIFPYTSFPNVIIIARSEPDNSPRNLRWLLLLKKFRQRRKVIIHHSIHRIFFELIQILNNKKEKKSNFLIQTLKTAPRLPHRSQDHRVEVLRS